MSNETNVTATYKTTRSNDRRKEKRIQNVKAGGDMMMYIGSAGLMMPMIRKAKESQNGIMGACAVGAGAILSVGLGNIASKILNKTIDKVVDFWDDVKPSGPAEKKQEEEENG